MKNLPNPIRIIINTCLFILYSLVSIIVVSFLFGFIVKVILGQSVPWSDNIIHYILALIVILIIWVLSYKFRNKMYLKLNTYKKELKKEEVQKKEEVEIKINKEIK